jgi:hypothetical protein
LCLTKKKMEYFDLWLFGLLIHNLVQSLVFSLKYVIHTLLYEELPWHQQIRVAIAILITHYASFGLYDIIPKWYNRFPERWWTKRDIWIHFFMLFLAMYLIGATTWLDIRDFFQDKCNFTNTCKFDFVPIQHYF